MIGIKNIGRIVSMGSKLHGLVKSIGHKTTNLKNTLSHLNPQNSNINTIVENNSNQSKNEYSPSGLKVSAKNSIRKNIIEKRR